MGATKRTDLMAVIHALTQHQTILEMMTHKPSKEVEKFIGILEEYQHLSIAEFEKQLNTVNAAPKVKYSPKDIDQCVKVYMKKQAKIEMTEEEQELLHDFLMQSKSKALRPLLTLPLDILKEQMLSDPPHHLTVDEAKFLYCLLVGVMPNEKTKQTILESMIEYLKLEMAY